MDISFKSSGFTSYDDILVFFEYALGYRELHKEESGEIARFVFDMTHDDTTGLKLDRDLAQIRDEFGALEAPGQSDLDAKNYVDTLWARLSEIVNESSKKKRQFEDLPRSLGH